MINYLIGVAAVIRLVGNLIYLVVFNSQVPIIIPITLRLIMTPP